MKNRIQIAILFIKEQIGESYYSDRLIAILEGRETYPLPDDLRPRSSARRVKT